MQTQIVTSGHALYSRVTRFIQTTYLERYSAHITHLPVTLVTLADCNDEIYCAAGLRDGSESFFSENYLDKQINQMIGELSKTSVRRYEIVEVTGLASRTPASSITFMRDLIECGGLLGYNWAVFTVTSRLAVLLKRMGLTMIDLGEARVERISNPEQWGTYYEDAPRVFAFPRPVQTSFPAQEHSKENFQKEYVNA